MRSLIIGSYIVTSDDGPPIVATLLPARAADYLTRRAIASTPKGLREAARLAFGIAADVVIPAHDSRILLGIAENYDGPQADEIRAIAARILLGRAWDGSEDSDGGDRVPLPEPAPLPPSGGAFADLLRARA